MTRRELIIGTAAAAFSGVARTAAAPLDLGPLAGSHYPDSRIESLDRRFKYALGDAAIERIATNCRWAEGPVYFADLKCLVWSDIPNDRLLRWNEEDGHISVFRQPSSLANGNTRDRQGRLVTCEQENRRITRTEFDGRITVLADGYLGKKFNSPNDLIVGSDNSVWFTDPDFGLINDYVGRKGRSEMPPRVYRVDAANGKVSIAADDFAGPNGLCFSPDEKRMYIIDSGVSASSGPPHIRAFDVAGGKLSRGKIFAQNFAPGCPDGMRVDTDGNVWCSMGWADPREDGVRCYAPNGDPIGKIHLPETCANLCFGGLRKNRLFMAASTSIYALYVDAAGAQAP